MSEPKFTGVWIPAGVFQTQTISLTAKVVYGVVDALDNEEGCFASNAYLSRHLGLSVRQLQTILSELEDARLIRRVAHEGHRVIRTVEKVALQDALASTQVTRTEGGAENRTGGVKKTARGGCGKPHTYSKEDNKELINTKGQPVNLDSIPWVSALPFSSEEFSKAWQSWIDYRKELKKPLKDATVTAQWKEFLVWGEAKSISSIEQSIKNGWQGLFEPKQVFGKGNTNVLTARDHEAF
jgi:hypothetical protein